MYERAILAELRDKLFKGRILILYGARQVGKTTLVNQLIAESSVSAVYLNCDEPDIRLALEEKSSSELNAVVGKNKLVVIDEAQRVKNIGLSLKLMADTIPGLQVIATGSSSFELANSIAEPLTGRKYEFHLYPLSVREWMQSVSEQDARRLVERRLIYGMYPEVVNVGGAEAGDILRELASSYLYKDILAWKDIRKPEILDRLLRALALQIGNEVSFTELASLVGVDKVTIENYLNVLEQAFIVFRIMPFSRNLRNELKKMRKVYFWDTGIRNAVINNLNGMDLRTDQGALWENFLMAERIKKNMNNGHRVNTWFWRTHQKKEMDYVEEEGGRLLAAEFKWGRARKSNQKVFAEAYPDSTQMVVNQENFLSFVG